MSSSFRSFFIKVHDTQNVVMKFVLGFKVITFQINNIILINSVNFDFNFNEYWNYIDLT